MLSWPHWQHYSSLLDQALPLAPFPFSFSFSLQHLYHLSITHSHTHRHSVAHLKLVSASSEFVSVHWAIIEHGRRSRSLSQLVAAVAFRENQIKLTVDGNIQTHTHKQSPLLASQLATINSDCLSLLVCLGMCVLCALSSSSVL